MSNYKLSEKIRQFIIAQKQLNPGLSCRQLVPLIKTQFQIELSKSLINKVIKQNNLNSPVGRRKNTVGTGQCPLPTKSPCISHSEDPDKNGPLYIQNGSCIFLKTADILLGLTDELSREFAVDFPEISSAELPKITEILLYLKLFKNLPPEEGVSYKNLGIWWIEEKEIPFSKVNELLQKLISKYNINKINELYKQYLSKLNSYTQTNFFPPEYQFLDPFAMKERFYSLPANIEKTSSLVRIQAVYSKDFSWQNDIIWLEGFSCAAKKVNEAKVSIVNECQIWINPSPFPSPLEGEVR